MPKEPDPVEDLPSPKSASTGGGKGGFLPAIITILAIPLVMGMMWEFYMMPSLEKLAKKNAGPVDPNAEMVEHVAPAKEEHGKEGKKGEAAAGHGSTYEVKDVVANLSGAMRSRYIKVSFLLEGRAKNFPEQMKEKEAIIRDATLAVLSDMTIQDMEEPGVKNIVRNKIINAIGQALRSNAVENLYFSEFVVQ